MSRQLRGLTLLLALCLSLTLLLAGCGEAAEEQTDRVGRGEESARDEQEEETKAQDEPGQPEEPQDAAGFTTEEALIREFLSCLESGEVSDAFWSAYDETGTSAYLISQDSAAITVSVAYDVLANSDRDADFIRRHFPDFAEHWREDAGEELTDEALTQLLDELQQTPAPTREDVEAAISEFHESFFPDGGVPSYDEAGIWSSDYGYSCYDVAVDDPENFITALEFYYIYRDGAFRWILLGRLAGGGEGG